jgi:cyclic pyranopterin phosphate synthase
MSCLIDSYQRQINYLRVSVTDRCNLRCIYCSAGSMLPLSHEDILRYEEIERIVQVAADMGINKIRITGGEPLMRLGLSTLVKSISKIDGIDDISLTTNGILLGRHASELKEAGLHRVNVSLDTLKPDRFKKITGMDRFKDVLSSIKTAREVELDPVKINMVVLDGINDDEIVDMARMSINEGWHVRFIEYMPIGITDLASQKIVSAKEITEHIQTIGKLEPYKGEVGNGPARYYRLPGASGTIGLITPMTEHFCHTCNRLRLTSDGQLRPCLLDDDEIDLKGPLRNGASTEELEKLIQKAVAIKRKQHQMAGKLKSQIRPMCQIGG